jgi:23S rRNA C2498 (ribose-2'-O)-methylase RlmM
MGTTDEIGKWLSTQVLEIEDRNAEPADPKAEDVRQLAASLKAALVAAQELQKYAPQAADVLVRHLAKPFAGYEGYRASWDPSEK